MKMKERKINRRKFIKAAIGGGFLLASGNIFSGCGEVLDGDGMVGKSDKIADLEINHLRQIITSNANETRCIMWQSNNILMKPAVELKANDSDKTYTFAALDCSFTDDDHINNQ